MDVDIARVEDISRELYIRALKILPDDIKQGFERLDRAETDAGGKRVLATMIRNIAVAEDTGNLLCQDTGIPIYNVTLGRNLRSRRRRPRGGDHPRLRARDARAPAALVGRASDHPHEPAHVDRTARASDQCRVLRSPR